MRERPLTDISPHNRRCLDASCCASSTARAAATALAADVQLREDPIIDETRLTGDGGRGG